MPRPEARAPKRHPASPLVHRNLPLLLLQARERVIARFRPALNAQGVTEQQWRIVRALLETGPLEPREIVDLCCISSPSLAGVLARMEQMGLVTRERLAHDQRRQLVSLTARSRSLAAQMAPAVAAAYAQIESQLGTSTMRQLHAVLDDLLQALDHAPVRPAPAAPGPDRRTSRTQGGATAARRR